MILGDGHTSYAMPLVLECLRLAENFSLPLRLDDFTADEQNEAPNVPRSPKVYMLKEFSGRRPNRSRRKITGAPKSSGWPPKDWKTAKSPRDWILAVRSYRSGANVSSWSAWLA
jgi:hypothetical protein